MNREKFLAGQPFTIGSQNLPYRWDIECECIVNQYNSFHATSYGSKIEEETITVYSILLGKSVEITVRYDEMTEIDEMIEIVEML